MVAAGLKERLGSGETMFGSFVFSPDPAVTEILALAGYDFAIADLEHASLGLADAVAHIRAGAAAGIPVLARVHGPGSPHIVQLLDAGAAGIVLPHFGLDRAASAGAVQQMRYNPAGARPTCTGTRAASYGLADFTAYARGSDASVVAVGLVEDAQVLPDLPALLRDSPVDLLMPGAADLSASLGMPGALGHERVREAIRYVLACGREAGIPVAVYVRGPADFEPWRALNPNAVVVSIDHRVLANAYRDLRESLASPPPAG
jgi:2-keto-3-deoxy-L-rhamnonate aldolase RhmA